MMDQRKFTMFALLGFSSMHFVQTSNSSKQKEKKTYQNFMFVIGLFIVSTILFEVQCVYILLAFRILMTLCFRFAYCYSFFFLFASLPYCMCSKCTVECTTTTTTAAAATAVLTLLVPLICLLFVGLFWLCLGLLCHQSMILSEWLQINSQIANQRCPSLRIKLTISKSKHTHSHTFTRTTIGLIG